MKTVFQILSLAAIVAFASVQQSQAQVVAVNGGSPIVVYNSVTTNLAGLGYIVIDCSAQRNVTVKWTLQLNGAGTEVHGIRLFPSNDPNSALPSAPTLATGYMLAIAANGTTPVIVQTNFDTLGYRYLVGGYITNGTAGLATNNLEYAVKRNAP